MVAVEIGRLCVKLAGRDAGRECLIIKKLDKNYVLIDGAARRRKCNIDHLQFLSKKADIKAGASHEDVIAALGKLDIKIKEKKKKEKPKVEVKKVEKKEKKPLLKIFKRKEKPKEKVAEAPVKKPAKPKRVKKRKAAKK